MKYGIVPLGLWLLVLTVAGGAAGADGRASGRTLTQTAALGVSVARPPAGRAAPQLHVDRGSELTRRTLNFVVVAPTARLAGEIACRCEALREELAKKWLVDDSCAAWSTPCVVVVHGTAAEYFAAAGKGGEKSSGVSTLRYDRGTVIYRRIDLRSHDRDPAIAALPHELTHVVLADRFGDRPLPRWADEGMAILADQAEKQAGHERDMRQSMGGSAPFRLPELLAQEEYPSAERVAMFYAQSASLVRYLASRAPPSVILDFLTTAQRRGYETAVREHYGLASLAELEREWQRSGRQSAVTAPVWTVGWDRQSGGIRPK